MEFTIDVKIYGRSYKLKVKRLYLDERTERYEVMRNNRSIVVESNRPFFRNRGLKHRRPDWILIGGHVKYGGSLAPVFDALMQALEPPLKGV
jgi:hypothetical protein